MEENPDIEETELWSEMKKSSQKKREKNRHSSTSIIMDWARKNDGIVLTFNEAHLRVNERFDFWPGTGKYHDRATDKYGRGVFNLIKELNKYKK